MRTSSAQHPSIPCAAIPSILITRSSFPETTQATDTIAQAATYSLQVTRHSSGRDDDDNKEQEEEEEDQNRGGLRVAAEVEVRGGDEDTEASGGAEAQTTRNQDTTKAPDGISTYKQTHTPTKAHTHTYTPTKCKHTHNTHATHHEESVA
jgi:hypothetical protein